MAKRPNAFGNALGSSLAEGMNGSSNPSGVSYVNEMDRASDNYIPSPQNTAQQIFKLDEIAQQNTQAHSDSLYGWSTGNDGLGFNGNGGAALRYGGVRASADSGNGLLLSDATENRLINGQTVTDFGDPYAVGGDGPTADPVRALQRLGNVLPTVKSGFFTDNFINKALNSDVPVLQRQLYGATLPAVALEQMGIGLMNAPSRIVSAIDAATGIFTAPTIEGKIISGLTALRDGSEGVLGLAPLVPASRWTAPIGFGSAATVESAGQPISPLLQRYLEESGGRWGGTDTRLQNHAIATDYEQAGARVTGGAGRAPEEWIPGPGGGTKGGTFVDMTMRTQTGTVRVQTVTAMADGTPTASEAAAAARIRLAFPNDQLILIPKVRK